MFGIARAFSALVAQRYRANSPPIPGFSCARTGKYPPRFAQGRNAPILEMRVEITSRNLVRQNATAKDYDALAQIEVDGSTRNLGIEYEKSAKAAARYRTICEVLDKDETADTVLYLTANDDILYVLAMELRATRKRIGFALSDSFRRLLLETRTLTNTSGSEIVPLRDLLVGVNS